MGFFEKVHPYVWDRGLVKLNGMYGYVDRQGRLAVAPGYTRASAFSEGLAVVGIEVEQPAVIAPSCGDDPWLREEVEALEAKYDAGSTFLSLTSLSG